MYRCDRKRRGKPPFYYQINGGTPHEDETELRVIFGVELTDYMSCVYLHQEVINALLVQEPKERQNALDRLMGLTNWRNLFEVQNSPEYKRLEAERDELQNFCDRVVTIGEAIEDVLRNSAKEKIDSTKTVISEIYRQLAGRSDFPDIKIDPDKYEVMAVGNGESEVALRILNKGDINCAALSIFLALATSEDLTHNIGFMVLDDPSQNLDPTHKARLASVLNRVLEKKQLVIATSEDDFATNLTSQFTKQKKVYRLERWTEETGPEIQVG